MLDTEQDFGWSRTSTSGRLPTLNTPGGPRRALVTGTASHAPFDACHDDMTLSHATLNKDSANRPGFGPARALAVRQTEHEWYRLLHRLNETYGAPGPAAALGLLVKRGSPHPASTPCANAHVPQSQLPEPLTVCVGQGQAAIFTLQGWDDDGGRDGELDDGSDDTDDVLRGVTLRLAEPGVERLSTSNLDVELAIDRPSPDPCQAVDGRPSPALPSGQR